MDRPAAAREGEGAGVTKREVQRSLFGDLHVHSREGFQFHTRTKAVTSRWPRSKDDGSSFIMPTLG